MASTLTMGSVVTSKQNDPDRIVLLGESGIGKTTWASHAPEPIFVSYEHRYRGCNPARTPEIETYEQGFDFIEQELLKKKHGYKTLVIDTIDALQVRIWEHLCERNKWGSISQPEFFEGYNVAADVMREFVALLDRVRSRRGMQVVLLGHVAQATHRDPLSPHDWKRLVSSMDRRAWAVVERWADTVLLARFEMLPTVAKQTRTGKATKVIGTTETKRVVHTSKTAAWDAKNSYGLPPIIELEYSHYAHFRDGGGQSDLKDEFERLLAELPEEHRTEEKVKSARAYAAKGQAELRKMVERFQVLIAEATGEEEAPVEQPSSEQEGE